MDDEERNALFEAPEDAVALGDPVWRVKESMMKEHSSQKKTLFSILPQYHKFERVCAAIVGDVKGENICMMLRSCITKVGEEFGVSARYTRALLEKVKEFVGYPEYWQYTPDVAGKKKTKK